jgi:hypothetical protein
MPARWFFSPVVLMGAYVALSIWAGLFWWAAQRFVIRSPSWW